MFGDSGNIDANGIGGDVSDSKTGKPGRTTVAAWGLLPQVAGSRYPRILITALPSGATLFVVMWVQVCEDPLFRFPSQEAIR